MKLEISRYVQVMMQQPEHSSRMARPGLRVIIIGLGAAAAFFLSLPLGRYHIPLSDVAAALSAAISPGVELIPDAVQTVLFNIRLPRILTGMLVGAVLSASGAVYQGMFRNPLVSPDILGASAGAGFGAAFAIWCSWGIAGIQVSAFICGLTAVLSAWGLSTRMRHEPMLALVLSGILIGTLFSAGTAAVKYIADPLDKLPAITFWLMGSLAASTRRDALILAAAAAAGLVPLLALRWRLNVLSLGDEEAQALGLETGKLRFGVIICATLMTTVSVSIGGMIGWVGLIVPHLARMIVGPNYGVLLPASALLGGAYLLVVDDLARMVAAVETPLGILTALIGVPFFLCLLKYNTRDWQ